MQKGISTRLDQNALLRLDEMADQLGKSRSTLIKNAVNHYLEYLTWYADEVQMGIDDVARGDYAKLPRRNRSNADFIRHVLPWHL